MPYGSDCWQGHTAYYIDKSIFEKIYIFAGDKYSRLLEGSNGSPLYAVIDKVEASAIRRLQLMRERTYYRLTAYQCIPIRIIHLAKMTAKAEVRELAIRPLSKYTGRSDDSMLEWMNDGSWLAADC